MDNRDIHRYVRKTERLLKTLYFSRSFQFALFAGLVSVTALLLISRLFMLPYYEFYAYAAGLASAISCILLSLKDLPNTQQAVQELDRFTPHNQLLTVWKLTGKNALTEELTNKTAQTIPYSYQLFRKERKAWLRPKWLIGAVMSGALMLLLLVFPSSLQNQANDAEKEIELVEDIKKEIDKIEKQAETETVKKELDALKATIAEKEDPEAVLKEIVKKQKEFDLKKRQLAQEQNIDAEIIAEDLEKASGQLAEQAGKTQTALSNMGKPVAFPLQQTIANRQQSSQGNSSGDAAGESSGEAGSSKSSSEASGNGEGTGEAGSSDGGSEDRQGQGQGQSESESRGQGQGQSESQGQAAGKGQGSRDLLTVPSRIGGEGETAVDNGEIGEGQAAGEQEGPVPATKGSVQPYTDVVGEYSASYFSSVDRLQLPPDLQTIVEQYFTDIETDE